MQDELTPWFYVAERPARPGWYEYAGWLLGNGVRFYWTGAMWGYWIGPGQTNFVHHLEIVTDRWRGLKAPLRSKTP